MSLARARACSAVSRLTMSLLVTETSAWHVLTPAARRTSSRSVSPITTRSPSRVLALVHARHADPQVVQLAHDPGTDVAQPHDDDVIGERELLAPQGSGEPGPDHYRRQHRQER